MKRRLHSSHVSFVSLVLLLCACSAQPAAPRPLTIADLRARAAAYPQDRAAARDLALAEIFGQGGDPARVSEALSRARSLDPRSPELLFADALVHDVHGQPAAALDGYLEVLDVAAASPRPDHAQLLEGTLYALSGLDGNVASYGPKARAALLDLLSREGLALSVRAAATDLLASLLQRAGDNAENTRISAAIGCVQEMRVAGPFGPRELLGFDSAAQLADVRAKLAERYDLGPGRGVRETRTARARGCTLHLGGGPVADAGTSFAQATLVVAHAAEYTVRLDTPNSVELFVDGQSVLRVDRRRHLGARVVFGTVKLSAGSHLITAVVATRHPNPVLELALAPHVAADSGTAKLPFSHVLPRDGYPLYLRALIALLRGDVLSARQMLSAPARQRDASALILLQRAGVALGDPLLPDDVRQDDARRLLAHAAQRDPGLWAPATQLATLAAKSGRVKESIDALRDAKKRWPEVPAVVFALIDLLRNKGFSADVEREVEGLRERIPDACGPLSLVVEQLRGRRRMVEAFAAAEALVRCDAQSSALYSLHLERRDWAAAERELVRLAALSPHDDARYTWLFSQLSLAKNAGDEAATTRLLAELRSRYPRSSSGAVEQIDALAAAGNQGAAFAALTAAVTAEPAAMAGLHRLAPVLGEAHPLSRYRRDGKAAIDAFEKSGRTYDGPQVLVLDYLALRIFEDGSAMQLVHTVEKAQSDEAVNEIAEVDVPEGAQLLTLRAWKPDGRRLEADEIAGKDSISLPNVAKGDYVELEYLQATAPPEGFPRGYLGDRFYFKSFEIPFDHSQMVVLVPTDMPYEIDPRGDAPKPVESLDGKLRVLDFSADQSVPLVAEPGSVSPREFIPSIRVGVRASFAAMIDSLRDALVDRDLYDPYYAALVREIVGEAAPSDYRLRAERLYAWVLENVENSDEVFAQSAIMLRAHSGNRARVLHYLLGLSGVPADLALARSATGDATPSTMADADTYDHLLVRVAGSGKKAEPIWLFTVERWAPFGFMPDALRGQEALLLAEGGPKTRVSQGLFGPDTRSFDVDIALRPDGSARIDATETVHGGDAVSWRGQLEQIPRAELERRFEQDYVSRLFPGATLVSLEITGREQHHPDLTLRYSVDVGSFGRPIEHGIALPPLLTTELSATFARTATRKTAELIAGSVHNVLTARIKLPARATLPALPEPAVLSVALSERPTFQQRHEAKNGVLSVTRSLTLPAMRVQPRQYPAFAEFCRRVDQAEAHELVVRLP